MYFVYEQFYHKTVTLRSAPRNNFDFWLNLQKNSRDFVVFTQISSAETPFFREVAENIFFRKIP